MRLKLITVAALLAALSACGAQGPANTASPAPGTDAIVKLTTTLQFEPAILTVPVGSTVEWRNTSIVGHSVSGNPATAEHPADVTIPAGAAGFEMKDLPAGQIYRHTFTVPGTYKYYCDPHHGLGMKGTIIVTS